jgi:hypothetical protein
MRKWRIEILTSDLPLKGSGVLGEVNVKTKSRKGRKIFWTDYSYSTFYGGFNGAKTGFVYPTVQEIFANENGKNQQI